MKNKLTSAKMNIEKQTNFWKWISKNEKQTNFWKWISENE